MVIILIATPLCTILYFTILVDMAFLSLTKNIRKYSDQNLVNKYNDNHPNALGHKIMAETIFEYLK